MAPVSTESWPCAPDRCAAASRCRAPPSVGAGAASGSLRRRATRPNGEEPTTMHDLDPAAGAMPEKPLEPPSGRRRRGRPKGSRNRATLALEAVLEGSAEELTHMLIAKALAGDGVALRFCVGVIL